MFRVWQTGRIMGGKLSKRKKGYDVSDPKQKKEESAVVATASTEKKAEAPEANQDGAAEIKAEQVAQSAAAPLNLHLKLQLSRLPHQMRKK
ncbi:hypothetical protein PHYPO_G00144300 [Pangasianodon hypophthalmus]|uniref:Uncharacterized protein n=1 Tax=Pangasianodon hypophthalmus TaxID=310915 RepID=A0A5N5K5T7_PANHP|nr:hypothetical protein PHYPO_G00144300 [Pangasianodon hypophthalmus]